MRTEIFLLWILDLGLDVEFSLKTLKTFVLLTASNYFTMKNVRRFGYVGNVRAFGKKTWKTDVCCLRLQCN